MYSMASVFAPAILAAGSFVAFPAAAATVTVLDSNQPSGTAIDLAVADFERIGNCGGGGSVVGDGCAVVAKSNPKAAHAFGRFGPLGHYWIDSQDINELKWTVRAPQAFTSLSFALTDAHDQPNSFFTMSYMDNGGWTPIWDIATRKNNGNLYWLSVDFGKAVNEAVFLFSTKVGAGYDGYGISTAQVNSPAPVPVPPAALLLGSGAVAMAGLGRRRRKGRG